MDFIECTICQEAYFVSEKALARHQQMCLATKAYSKKFNRSRKHRSSSSDDDITPDASKKQRRISPPAESREPGPSTAPPGPSTAPPGPSTAPPKLKPYIKRGLLSCRDYTIDNPDTYYRNTKNFLNAALPVMEKILRDELKTSPSLKYNIVLLSFFNHHEEGTQEEFNFKTTTRTIYSGGDDLRDFLAQDTAKLMTEETEFEGKGSGWSLDHPSSITVRVSRFSFKKPTGKSYTVLPKRIIQRKATINIQNSDSKCFIYSLLVKHLPNVDVNSVLNENSFVEY